MRVLRSTMGPFSLILIFAVPIPGEAYETATHRQLSVAAFDLSGISSTLQWTYGIAPDATFKTHLLDFEAGPQTPAEWVRLGGSAEDMPPWRVLNHFYDPISGGGSGILGAVAAPDWALEDGGDLDGQRYSYKDARDAFYRGLTASDRDRRERELGHTFYTLGHVIHLIQDMAQPQHTRNDLHLVHTPLEGLIEKYVERNIRRFALTRAPIPFVRRPRDLWADNRGSGFAQFSNANFVSAGTNFIALRDGATAERYASPVLDLALQDIVSAPAECRDGVVAPGPMTFFANTFLDRVSGGFLTNPRMTTYSIFDQYLIDRGRGLIFALNCFNIDAAADILLPRAAAYSAVLLQYFFRGRLGINMADNRFLLSNETPGEAIDGRFEVYYDTPEGVRLLLTQGPLSLGPNQVTGILQSPGVAAGIDGPCFLVFRGRMGDEADAVTGMAIGCPRNPATSPTPPSPPPTPPTPPGDALYGYKVFYIENLYPQFGEQCLIVTPPPGSTWPTMLHYQFFYATHGVYAEIRSSARDECP